MCVSTAAPVNSGHGQLPASVALRANAVDLVQALFHNSPASRASEGQPQQGAVAVPGGAMAQGRNTHGASTPHQACCLRSIQQISLHGPVLAVFQPARCGIAGV